MLEFLGLPDSPSLRETTLEQAIITHLQKFLLELGKGFAFVGRQKRLRFDDTDLYIDLVFYNCIIKCYLLIQINTAADRGINESRVDSMIAAEASWVSLFNRADRT